MGEHVRHGLLLVKQIHNSDRMLLNIILSASSEVICHDALTHLYFELFTPHDLIVCAFYA